MNKYSYWQHICIFATTDSGVDHHHSVRCTVTVYPLHIWIHCHGNNSIRYSDEYQQARSLAMSPYLHRQLRNDILHLRGGAPLLLCTTTLASHSQRLCRSHFVLKYEDLKPKGRHFASSIWKRNHKATNRQWSHHIIIDVELTTHIVHPQKSITLQSKSVCEWTSVIAWNGI